MDIYFEDLHLEKQDPDEEGMNRVIELADLPWCDNNLLVWVKGYIWSGVDYIRYHECHSQPQNFN